MEGKIINLIRRFAATGRPESVRIGIGDDTAVLASPPANREILVTTDQIIERTHFVRGLHPPRALGSKTLARGLSDIAAMGGDPLYAFLSLGIPPWAAMPWLKHYMHGLFDLARTFDVTLAGGDVARSEIFSAAITVVGSAPKGRALTRGGARPGDRVFVSGKLGGSALGLERLLAGKGAGRGAAERRHLSPQPRIRLGRFLREKRLASAAMDLSDGLSSDLARLCLASGVGAELERDRIPVFPGASAELALHGGEEYELLFTAPPRRKVPEVFENLSLTLIGRITEKHAMVIVEEGVAKPLKPAGFEHFPQDSRSR